MSAIRVRAIIPYQDGLLLIHRVRNENGNKREYYVFPGGGVEEGEGLEDAIKREVFEELGIEIKPLKELYRLSSEGRVQVFYLCHYVKGRVGTGTGPEFQDQEYASRGSYTPKVIPLDKINTIDLLHEVRKALEQDLEKYGSFEKINPKEIQ
tara:strand:- start:1227 stop:1682 length:456 start_codon:yes stop_codon:yes gene_type:complete